MIDIRRWIWKLDMTGMLCTNDENKVIVKLFKEGKGIKGKILDMSIDLYRKIAGLYNGPKIIQQIIFAAEDEYLKEKMGNLMCASDFLSGRNI